MGRTLVVTDLDGSFWDEELRCHGRTLDAVGRLNANGVPLLVATGRRANSARAGLVANDLHLPAVLLNGALGVDFRTDDQFHSRPFTRQAAAEVVNTLAAVELYPVMYLADGSVRGPEQVTTAQRHRTQLLADYIVADAADVADNHDILGFSMIGLTHERLEPVLAAVPTNVADVDLYNDKLFQAWSVHLQPVGLSKWDGIQAYLAHAGLQPERIVVIGDQTNDLEMLRNADVALGVAGGHESVLDLADRVIPHPRDGGWAEVLDHLL
ncbi:MAG: HAD family hydrolase [Actinomycetota bacterium]